MATLTNTKIKDTYPGLLKITDNGIVEATEQVVTDGLGNNTVLSIGTASASFSSDIEVNQLTIGRGSGDLGSNTVLGFNALDSNTTGSSNTAIGSVSMNANTTGSQNTALGYYALYSNTTGGSNTALGYSALGSNTTGIYNTAVGVSSLYDNTTGDSNTALGYHALRNSTTGDYNTALGSGSLLLNSTGYHNTAVGFQSLRANTIGYNNTSVGIYSLDANTEGAQNTALGYSALTSNTTGDSNVAIGYDSLVANTTGDYNIGIGRLAGDTITTGSNNVYIGNDADASAADVENEIVIGASATGNGSNTATYGNSSITSHHFTSGQVNVAGNLAVDTNTLYVDAAANTVSVGKTLADTKFDVLGNGKFQFQSGATNNTAPNTLILSNITTGAHAAGVGASLQFEYFNTSGGYAGAKISSEANADPNTSDLVFYPRSYGYSEAMRIDSSGRVGIGESNPENDNKLHIKYSEVNVTPASNSPLVVERNDVCLIQTLTSNASDAGILFGDGDDNDIGGLFYLHSSDAMTFRTNTSERMRIDSSGRVGIGTAASTNSRLNVTSSSAIDDVIRWTDAISDTGYLGIDGSGGVKVWAGGFLSFGAGGGGSFSERMRIDSSGNVKIKGTNTKVSWERASDSSPDIVYLTKKEDISSNGNAKLHGYDGIVFSTEGAETEKMRIDSLGRVGIGTSSPAEKLDVIGGALAAGNGTIRTGITYSSLGLVGTFTNHDLGIITNGTERMRIDSSGNVIIKESAGAFTPATNGLSLSTGYGVSYLFSKSSGGTEADMYYNAANQIFNTGGSERMRIDSSGTTHITSSKAYGNQTATLRVQTIPTGTNYTDGAFNNIVFGNESIANGYLGQIAVVQENASASTATTMRFFTNTGGGNDATSERMRIDSSGRVGIGTSSISATYSPKLQVESTASDGTGGVLIGSYLPTLTFYDFSLGATIGQIQQDGTGLVFKNDGSERMRITSGGYVGVGTGDTDIQSGDLIGVLAFNSSDSSTNSAGAIGSIRSYASAAFNTGQVSGDLRFYTQDAGAPNGSLLSGSERMRITSGGDVLVGKQSSSLTTAGVRLAPNGTSEFIAQGNDNSPLTIGSADDVSLTLVTFTAGGGTAGSISISGGTSTSYNTSSDYRLKENVVPMEGALDRVDALKPSRFNFISDPEKTVDGFLAHEVAEVVPEAIYGEKDAVDEEGNPIYQGIDQSKIVPLLVGAIKELKAEIELLKSQING